MNDNSDHNSKNYYFMWFLAILFTMILFHVVPCYSLRQLYEITTRFKNKSLYWSIIVLVYYCTGPLLY